MNRKTFFIETFISEFNKNYYLRMYGRFNTDKANTYCEYHAVIIDRKQGTTTEKIFADGEFTEAVQYTYAEMAKLEQKYSEVKL